MITICPENHTKLTNKLCEHKARRLMLKQIIYIYIHKQPSLKRWCLSLKNHVELQTYVSEFVTFLIFQQVCRLSITVRHFKDKYLIAPGHVSSPNLKIRRYL
jgi:hypothetical protein